MSENVNGLKVTLFDWLFLNDKIDELEQQCENHNKFKSTSTIFRCTLQIDPMELCDYNATLGNHLLHNPQIFWQLLQDVCFVAISTAKWLPWLLAPSQVMLVLRLSCLPDLPCYVIRNVRDMVLTSDPPQFVRFTGVVCSVSERLQYTQSVAFCCQRAGCRGAELGRAHTRLHAVGSREVEITLRKPNCSFCGDQLMENIAHRTLGDKMIVKLVPTESLQMSASKVTEGGGFKFQEVTVVLRDDLCDNVTLGSYYIVIGIVTPQDIDIPSGGGGHVTLPLTLEANNIYPKEFGLPLKIHQLPQKILDVHQACQYSPWTFSASMAYSFAAEVVPPGTYHHLKLAALLSLVMCRPYPSDRSHDIHLMVVDGDPELVMRLLSYAGTYAPRFMSHSSVWDITGSLRKETDSVFVDGGAMLLAKGGICLAGNLSVLKKDTIEKLHKGLESHHIHVDRAQKFQDEKGKDLTTTWPVDCAVWLITDQVKKKASFSKADIDILKQHSMHETTSVSKAFADGFTLVMLTDVGDTNELTQQALTEDILSKATGQEVCTPLKRSDFEKLIECAQNLQPEFTPAARSLIQNFYTANRRVRTSSVHGTSVPISGLEAMSRLAEAHAKLSLRKEVILEDALLAISLYEESLVDRFGYSVLNLSSNHHFKMEKAGMYIGAEFDQWMRQMERTVHQFCKCYSVGEPPGGAGVMNSANFMPEE